MKKILLAAVVLGILFMTLMFQRERLFSGLSAENFPAGPFFKDSSTPDALKAKFSRAGGKGDPLTVLIVPGHDEDSSGAVYRGLTEAEVTALLGEKVFELFSKDTRFRPMLLRDRQGYREPLASFFEKRRGDILRFRDEHKAAMRSLVEDGLIDPHEEGVIHNPAPRGVAEKLYGVNLWANENKIDIILHLHFND
ncbi:MAG: hypothetical protein G01um101472_601, partial [Parcubacteria group bacterium Gr01-1014_72]